MELVYFLGVHCGATVKIGWTGNIVQRVQKLCTYCPDDLVLLGVRPGGKELESSYHSHFSSIRKHGEWFNFDHEVVPWLAAALRADFTEAWEYTRQQFAEHAPDFLREHPNLLIRPMYFVDCLTARRFRGMESRVFIEGGRDE